LSDIAGPKGLSYKTLKIFVRTNFFRACPVLDTRKWGENVLQKLFLQQYLLKIVDIKEKD